MKNCVRNRCWILSSYHWQTHRIKCIIFIVFVLSSQIVCNAKINRIERRFMWKQMDMDGLLGGVASSARVMTSMFRELLPTIQTTANILDYLPAETTRVKYIIRNPTSKKAMKVIKIRHPKKVIKIITAPKPFVETKPEKIRYLSTEAMQILEKEQEMIVEGRLPLKKDKLTLANLDHQIDNNSKEFTDIANEKFFQFGNDGWLPVYETSTIKPHVMTPLHTSITAEPLQRPEKPVHHSSSTISTIQENEGPSLLQHYYEIPPQENTYEVTEYVADETVALPFTYSYRHNARGGFTPAHNIQLFPSISTTSSAVRNRVPTATANTTSTEEPPNYPISFLRQYRERIAPPSTISLSPTSISHILANETFQDTVWMPNSTNTYKATHMSNSKETKQKPNHNQANVLHMKNKWSAMPTTLTATTTRLPFREITEKITRINKTFTPPSQSLPTKTIQTSAGRQNTELTASSVLTRNRGTIKFGDKLS